MEVQQHLQFVQFVNLSRQYLNTKYLELPLAVNVQFRPESTSREANWILDPFAAGRHFLNGHRAKHRQVRTRAHRRRDQ